MSQTVPFLDLEELRQEGRSPHRTRQKIYKIILSRCHDRIKKMNKSTQYRECYYDIPIFLPGYPVYSIPEAKHFLISNLIENGLKAESVGEARIYVSWKPEDTNQEQFVSKAQKATNRPATYDNFNPESNLREISPSHSQRNIYTHSHTPIHNQTQSRSQILGVPGRGQSSMNVKKSGYEPPKYDPDPPVYQPPPYHINGMRNRRGIWGRKEGNFNFRPKRYPKSIPTNQAPVHQNLQRQSENVKPKPHTIFAEKPDIIDAFKKPIDQVEPPKYVKARTINIIPEESPITYEDSNSRKKSKKGKKEDLEDHNVSMLQYDRKFADMLPVNKKKVGQVYPDLLARK